MILIFNWLLDLVKVLLQCKDTTFLEYANFFASFLLRSGGRTAGGERLTPTDARGMERGGAGRGASARRPAGAQPTQKEGTIYFFIVGRNEKPPGSEQSERRGGRSAKRDRGDRGKGLRAAGKDGGGNALVRHGGVAEARPRDGDSRNNHPGAQRGRSPQRRRGRRPSPTQAHECRPTPTPPL